MRRIDMIVIHCSATREGMDFRARDIDSWHRSRGFSGIGYHYVIDLDGTVERGRDEEEVGAHVSGHNKYSIGVCYIGGLDSGGRPKDTRTAAQRASLYRLVSDLQSRYPGAEVLGHRDLDDGKACPCFDARAEYGNGKGRP